MVWHRYTRIQKHRNGSSSCIELIPLSIIRWAWLPLPVFKSNRLGSSRRKKGKKKKWYPLDLDNNNRSRIRNREIDRTKMIWSIGKRKGTSRVEGSSRRLIVAWSKGSNSLGWRRRNRSGRRFERNREVEGWWRRADDEKSQIREIISWRGRGFPLTESLRGFQRCVLCDGRKRCDVWCVRTSFIFYSVSFLSILHTFSLDFFFTP